MCTTNGFSIRYRKGDPRARPKLVRDPSRYLRTRRLSDQHERENSRRGGGEGGGGADEGKDGKDTHRYEVEVDGEAKRVEKASGSREKQRRTTGGVTYAEIRDYEVGTYVERDLVFLFCVILHRSLSQAFSFVVQHFLRRHSPTKTPKEDTPTHHVFSSAQPSRLTGYHAFFASISCRSCWWNSV